MGLRDYLIARTGNTGLWEAGVCWPWLLSTGSHGYGQGYYNGEVRTAHSMWFQLETGIRLEGFAFTIHHICHNKVCCNPAHMEILSNATNARDNGFAGRTHCPQGHEYTENNIYWTRPRRPNGGRGRLCRACTKAHNDTRRTS